MIGTVREIKAAENRVGLTPAGVNLLHSHGHRVLVEAGAGLASGFSDAEYAAAGGSITPRASDIWSDSDLLVKVKEPLPAEFSCLSERTALFAYLHLAAAKTLTTELLNRRVMAIAYETVQLADGSLPLLEPMSTIAGKMAVQVGAHLLERAQGGSGTLLGGAPGVASGVVVVLGSGTVGLNAARIAAGMGARTIILGRNPQQLGEADLLYHGSIETRFSTPSSIAESVAEADLLICAVASTGAAADKLVTRTMIASMRPGSVLVDVSIDQGGCSETSHVTTHDRPTYVDEGVIHYCVANMPGAVPRTSTPALTNSTLPFVAELANEGILKALSLNSALRWGLNTHAGRVTNAAVARALGLDDAASTS